MVQWNTERRKISDLIPAESNPRKLTDKQAKDLGESLSKFDLADPIIINQNNHIIGGHQRFQILRARGVEEVDVRVPDHLLTELEEKELNIRLNKNTGQWDYDLLANIDPDLLINVGFEADDMDMMFFVREYDFNLKEEAEHITPETKTGDMFLMDGHKLICGDSCDIENYRKLFDGEQRARMVFTDPPYNVNYSYDWRSEFHDGKKVAHKFFSDKKSDQDYYGLIRTAFTNAYEFTTDDASYYCWYADKFHSLIRAALEDSKWMFSQVIIWIKNRQVLSPGQDFHRTHEPCLHGWKKGNKHFFNKVGNYKDILNFEDYELRCDSWFQHRDNIQEYQHPTQKPVRLPERGIKKSSEINDIVLDMFGGSGSTLIACEQLKRRCFMIEIDTIYCEAIVKRWETFTGKKAEKTCGSLQHCPS